MIQKTMKLWLKISQGKNKYIDYEKFIIMQNELGDDSTDEETVLAILKTFYSDDKREWTECINEFNNEITNDCTKSINLKLDFENKPAEYFIIADTYLSKSDLVSLYNHLSGNNVKSISVSLALKVKKEFLKSVEHFKEKWEWIYNPPVLPGINKHTIGRQLRTEFQQYYGAYAEITYLISNGNALKFDKVNKIRLEEYLSLGEYLLRKKSIESVD